MAAYSPAEIHALFQDAFNRGDVEALTALYESDAVLVLGGTEVIGRESIRQAFQTILARRGRITLETRAVVASHPGVALLHGDWTITPPTQTGSETPTRGLSTEVVRRQPDGTWMFVIDNPSTPGLRIDR